MDRLSRRILAPAIDSPFPGAVVAAEADVPPPEPLASQPAPFAAPVPGRNGHTAIKRIAAQFERERPARQLSAPAPAVTHIDTAPAPAESAAVAPLIAAPPAPPLALLAQSLSSEAPLAAPLPFAATPVRSEPRVVHVTAAPVAPAVAPVAATLLNGRAATLPAKDTPPAPADFHFGELDLDAPTLRAIYACGYREPTPIQCEVIPLLLAGRDVVGQAQTGTGKTAAFGIPIAMRVDATSRETQVVVLVPTRELAVQVAGELERLGRCNGFSLALLYGGVPIARQLHALAQGAQVVVGTPGRVMDHMQRRTLDLANVRFAVLDEADEMLDIGFADDMEYILRHTPRTRQTALFSATVPTFIRRLIYRYLREPAFIHINPEDMTVDEIEQVYYEVSERDKLAGLRTLLEQHDSSDRYLIFRRMQRGVDQLAADLDRAGYPVRGLHGGLRQEERTRIMTAFRAGELPILVATNVAARGLDITGISHVVNYDMPDNLEEYVHRIGRTGRAGRTGIAITFAGEWDLAMIDAIKQEMGERLQRRLLPIYELAAGQ